MVTTLLNLQEAEQTLSTSAHVRVARWEKSSRAVPAGAAVRSPRLDHSARSALSASFRSLLASNNVEDCTVESRASR